MTIIAINGIVVFYTPSRHDSMEYFAFDYECRCLRDDTDELAWHIDDFAWIAREELLDIGISYGN